MTTTTLALTFTPRPWTPEGAGEFQQLQALFKAAAEVRQVPGNLQTIGDPTISIAYEFWLRVAHRQVDPSSPQNVLEYLSANYPGISTKIADPVDTIDGMGQTARYQDAAIEALQKRVDDRDAEIGRLKIDLAHYREAAEGMTAQRVRELEEKLMMEQGYSSSELALAREALEAEERKVADLSAELARRMVQDIREEVDGATERIKASVTSIAADTALAVLNSLAPYPPTDVGAAVELHQVRVLIHHDVVRVVVADDIDPEILEHIEVEVGDKIGDRLGLDSSVVVQAEPGEAAPGFRVRGGEAASAEAPTLRWYWRHESDALEDEQGPLASEAAAVDATWDEHAIDTAEEMPSHAGDEP